MVARSQPKSIKSKLEPTGLVSCAPKRPWIVQWSLMVPRWKQQACQIMRFENKKLQYPYPNEQPCRRTTRKRTSRKPACLHAFQQRTNKNQNISNPASPAMQRNQQSTATNTQASSRVIEIENKTNNQLRAARSPSDWPKKKDRVGVFPI